MKATELRLGNWITDGEGENFQVTEIVKDGTTWAGALGINTLGFEAEDYGIPLTKEWLKYLGFKQEINDVVWDIHVNGFTIHFERNDGHLECYLESVGIDIEYVHQLQNLYFALTGEELTLKE